MPAQTVNLKALARQLDLPYYVLLSFLERHGYCAERRYPRQHRRVFSHQLPALMQLLQAEGYAVAEPVPV